MTLMRRSKGLRYLLLPLVTLSGLWYGADVLLAKINGTVVQEIVPGGLVLQKDRQGHFRGTGTINDTPVTFLIDTGATITTIPAKIAVAARLKSGTEVKTHTAGGIVMGSMVIIDSLKIGGVEITNLNANINDHIDEVLIGMNTLKFFDMTQSGDTLTLIRNKSRK